MSTKKTRKSKERNDTRINLHGQDIEDVLREVLKVKPTQEEQTSKEEPNPGHHPPSP